MKSTFTLLKFLAVIIFILTLTSCSREAEEVDDVEDPSAGKIFKNGIPKIFQGKYYYSELSKYPDEDDHFYSVVFTKRTVDTKDYSDEYPQIFDTDYSHHKISKNTYILCHSGKYLKAVKKPSGQIAVSDDEIDYRSAVKAKLEKVYDNEKPDSSFGITTENMFDREYVSDQDFTRYYEIDYDRRKASLSNFILWQVNADGTESIIEKYDKLVAKKGRFHLVKEDTDEYKVLSIIGKNKLKDAETGEEFKLYSGKTSPKEEVWKKLGIKMKEPIKPVPNTSEPIIHNPEPTPVKPKKSTDKYSDPNYDPELDDDYLDDYNEAEFQDQF